MTATGSAYTRFRRAVATRDPLIVRAAAAELPTVGLHHALEVCLVMAERESASFPRYAVRWHSRLCREIALSGDEAQLALASVLALTGPGREAGLRALVALGELHQVPEVVRALEEWDF